MISFSQNNSHTVVSVEFHCKVTKRHRKHRSTFIPTSSQRPSETVSLTSFVQFASSAASSVHPRENAQNRLQHTSNTESIQVTQSYYLLITLVVILLVLVVLIVLAAIVLALYFRRKTRKLTNVVSEMKEREALCSGFSSRASISSNTSKNSEVVALA